MQNGNTQTPVDSLVTAILADQQITAEYLAKNLPAAYLHSRNHSGNLPLVIAVGNDNIEVVRILLARGADPEVCDAQGYSARSLATMRQNREVIAMISDVVDVRRKRAAENRRAAMEAVKAVRARKAVVDVRDRLRHRAVRRPKVKFRP